MTSPIARSRAKELLARMERFSSPSFKKQMKERFGINTAYALGTPVTTLRLLVKGLPYPDPELAEALWQTNIHEARIMASMLADPAQMTLASSDNWVKEFNSWDICDMCCLNLFSKVKSPFKLAERWIKREDEFVRRAGFAILACLAMPRAKTKTEDLINMLPLIKNHSCDPRPMVYKAVNWALRNIGKKNQRLTPYALQCARDILDLYAENRTAVWVAKNALWELSSPKIQALLARRK